jgi:hypothetical protein
MSSFIFSFDFESRGYDFRKHGPCAIGIVVFDVVTQKEVECYSTGVAPEEGMNWTDEACNTQFWDKHLDVKEWCIATQKPMKDVCNDILNMYDKYTALGNVTWVAYPAAYDWHLLKSMMEQVGVSHERLGYTANCLSERIRMLKFVHKISTSEIKQNIGFVLSDEDAHYPDRDARAQGIAFLKSV